MPRLSKRHWLVSIPSNKFTSTRAVTWGNIKTCIRVLNESGDETFAGLHRAEGGFMCVEGPGFRSDEIIDSGLPDNRQRPKEIIHKEIRFGHGYNALRLDWADWPSCYNSFLRNPLLTDEWVVFERGAKTSLLFQGDRCAPWTRNECKAYAEVVAESLGLVREKRNLRKRGRVDY
jgi:hypothetical protein